ncbi:MAG: Glucose 1-dehydrogenase [Chlamydiae bacterium]|nr:Glucose 1-dehydrogenase [Chlamydiota bacterium]
MRSIANRTILITGASRGIGRAIALRCAQDGANIAILAKTDQPNPKLPGTIHTVAEEIQEAGGKALPLKVDVRFEDQVHEAVSQTVEAFGGIDILINNASAIFAVPTMETPMKRFDLMHQCNARATFCCSQACLPHLKKSDHAHILNMSPPLNMNPKWFQHHLAYTMSKYGMSMCTLGMAAEFAEDGISVNSLWPKTTIATSAIEVFFPSAVPHSRKDSIVSDAAHLILTKENPQSGQFYIDEDLLREEGVNEFEKYAVSPGVKLQQDFFIDDGDF